MTAMPLLLIAFSVQVQAADSIFARAKELSESALVAEARAAPLAIRAAVGQGLHAGDVEGARRLGTAYAIAWQDSFLVREVARFAAWSPERRAARLYADSVRREGITVYRREGAAAAIAVWRQALARAAANRDTALIAGLNGNIGAAFLANGALDSASVHFDTARSLAGAVGDRRVELNAVLGLGGVAEERGDLAAAAERYTRALVLSERIRDTRGLAAGHNNLGILAWTTGDLSDARRHFEAALAINRSDGNDEAAATNLVNLAGLASLSGDLAVAERLYRDALGTWRARGARTDAADALYGLGQLALRRGDYPAAQRDLLDALAIYAQTGPVADELATRRALAATLAARGELQGALDALRQASDLADGQDVPPSVTAGIALTRADLAVRLNALAEAEELYALAMQRYRQAGNLEGEAEANHGMGLLSLWRGDHARAEALFESALRVQQASGDERAAALTRLELGRVARARGDTALARRQVAQAIEDLDDVADPIGLAAALGERALLESNRGMIASTEASYREALALLADRAAPDIAWRLHAGLAGALRARGAPDDAARELRAAVAQAERAGSSLVLAERRAGFLADKWDAYAVLAATEHARGLPGAAFRVSERLRAREMLEMLGRGRIEGAPLAAELVAREQDLRRLIAELSDELEGAPRPGLFRGPPPVAAKNVAREALFTAQGDYSELLLEMRERAPRHAALVSQETAGWRDVARRLRADEALVEYLIGDSVSIAFVVVRDSLAIVNLGISRRALARLVSFARGAVESPSPGADSLWFGPFQRLHRHLIAPAEETGLLEGKTRLLLVPHAELHYLPFGALRDGEGRVLVRQYEFAVTPSATVWLALGDRPSRRVGDGILAMAPLPSAMPGSTREVAAIARLAGPDVRVVFGEEATEAAFLRAAPGSRVIHLATYGVLNKHNPLFSFVEFAADGSSDGRLEVHEVFGLDLTADLVVLSACQTALGSGRQADIPAGDDWIGLTRAFLHAGADNVVATLWAVEDLPSAALMEEFYEHYVEGADPSRALVLAQRAMLAERPDAHPFHWAGFVAVGGSPQ